MNDFASAAMVRVLLDGLRLLGLPPPGPAALQAPRSRAHVPLAHKRQTIAWAVEQGGLSCLPLLGRGFHQGVDDPLYRALVPARDAADLLRRWCRLERYVHSRHRIEVLEIHGTGATLRHLSVRAGSQPGAAEDLVVLGVLLALLEASGHRAVRATMAGLPVYPAADGAGLRQLAQQGRTATWQLHWAAPVPDAMREPPAAWAPASHGPPADLCQSLPWPDLAQRCARLLVADLMHRPSLAELAHATGTSARSLQRTLAGAGLTYSAVLAEARLRAAAWWLVESTASMAEIGFVAGYADQAHFTRDFGQRTGLPPGRYRADFAATRPAKTTEKQISSG